MTGQLRAVLAHARGHRRDESGAAAVEFALILVPFLVLLFGLIQYGLYFYSSQTGSHVANSAARQLAVGNCDTPTELQTFVDNKLGGAKTEPATVAREYRDNATLVAQVDAEPGDTVRVSITFKTINMNFPFLPFLSDPEVTRTVDARLEDTQDEGCPS